MLSIYEAIDKLDFFSNLTKEQQTQLIDISAVYQYNEDYILHYENTQTQYLFFLVEGRAKSYKIDKNENDIFLFYIYENSLLSEISNINQTNLTFFSNIAFVEKSIVLSVEYNKFKQYFLDTNILMIKFANEIISRSSKLESLINREFIFDAVAKVAMMIGTDLDMFNKLKRHDISLILHIQPATLSRVLNRLKKNNLIDIVQGKVSIIDKNNLEILYKD